MWSLHGSRRRALLPIMPVAGSAGAWSGIRTVEGLAAADGTLSPLQQAFWETHALQCGFCIPGVLMTLTELLAANQTPSEAEIRERITGNICRCTGYQSIIEATLLAAERLRQGREVA